MDTAFRKYRPQSQAQSDFDAAVAIYMGCFSSPPFRFAWLRESSVRRYFRDMEATPGFMGFTSEYNGAAAGICLGLLQDYFESPAFEIREFLVSPNHQGQGVGSALLAGAEAALAGAGVKVVSLSTGVRLDAFGFYKKNGFAVMEGTVWMGKAVGGEECYTT